MKRPGGFDGGAFEPPDSSNEAVPVSAVDDDAADIGALGVGAADVSAAAHDQHADSSGVANDDQPTAVITPIGRALRRAGRVADTESTIGTESAIGAESTIETEIAMAADVTAPAQLLDERASGDPVRIAAQALKRAQRELRRRSRREQRRFTSHRRRRRRYWAIAGLVVLALAVFVAAGVLSPLMSVRSVEIRGASLVNVDDLEQALSRFDGVPLALVSENDVHAALEPFPLVERYAIERIPPHTLVVRITERVAVAAIEDDGHFTLIDAAGVVVGTADEQPAGVPVASGAVLDVSTPAFAAAAHAVRDMPQDLRAQLGSVTASSAQDVTFTLTGGTEVLWGEVSETQLKSQVLRALLAALGPVSFMDVSIPETPVFRQ